MAEVRRVLAPGGRLLIFERKLKKSSGHGIDATGADRVAQMLTGHGYVSADVGTVRIGRVDYMTVSAVNPNTV
jgi:hypothetical protein